MEHSDDPTLHGWAGTRHASLSLFLALYLMLLAFFIALIAHSTFEEQRSMRAMDSLNATFQRFGSTALGRFTGDAGTMVAEARAFKTTARGLFEGAIPAAKVEDVGRGRLLDVTVPAESLFEPGLAAVRRPHLRLLDRLVAAMASPPEGYRYIMEFLTASDYSTGETSGARETLALDRAGSLARTMVARGAPPDMIVAGVTTRGAAGPDEAVFRFSLVEAEAADLDWQGPIAGATTGGGTERENDRAARPAAE
ncbi:hypothetical protein [Caenispirillum salinarum]|uniref:hypothetical protein n=1 Tax=Caenispirillum salinarum TaxID=859058 RepID=UPI00384CD6D3